MLVLAEEDEMWLAFFMVLVFGTVLEDVATDRCMYGVSSTVYRAVKVALVVVVVVVVVKFRTKLSDWKVLSLLNVTVTNQVRRIPALALVVAAL